MSVFISIWYNVTDIENKRNINLTHPNPEIKYFILRRLYAREQECIYTYMILILYMEYIQTKFNNFIAWRVRFSERKTKQCQTMCPLLSETCFGYWMQCMMIFLTIPQSTYIFIRNRIQQSIRGRRRVVFAMRSLCFRWTVYIVFKEFFMAILTSRKSGASFCFRNHKIVTSVTVAKYIF